MTDINQILADRGSRYGEFEGHAQVTQALKEVMYFHPNWKILESHHKEALEMIQHKIGRILNGDPTYRDSWDDIAGYARLVPPIDEKRAEFDTDIHEEEDPIMRQKQCAACQWIAPRHFEGTTCRNCGGTDLPWMK